MTLIVPKEKKSSLITTLLSRSFKLKLVIYQIYLTITNLNQASQWTDTMIYILNVNNATGHVSTIHTSLFNLKSQVESPDWKVDSLRIHRTDLT